MNSSSEWQPSAGISMLRLRARLLAAARAFFDERGYFEVDVPLLSHDRAVDPHLEPFVALVPPGGVSASSSEARGLPMYLQTSPEFGMKRLLAAGAGAIYQLSHVWRRGELGARHNPEFTMLEWYRAGDSHLDQMQVVEDFLVAMWRASADFPREAGSSLPACPQLPFSRTTYRDAFLRHAGADVMKLSTPDLGKLAVEKGICIPAGMTEADRDDWLNLLLAELVEPRLGIERPDFLFDYPASQAALAKVRDGEFPVAERFELYLGGVEFCNGYHELTDPQELRRRITRQNERLGREGRDQISPCNRLLTAMESGLPESSGVALGFDRLLMWITGTTRISDVIPFPFERA